MPIPKEILAVKRPKNTVVTAYGKNRDRYAVRQRVGCRYVDGRRLPVNGPTVGHIIDGVYVPVEKPAAPAAPRVDVRDWGNVALCESLLRDLRGPLADAFGAADALAVRCVAILRTCVPGVGDGALQDACAASFLPELCPGADLSEDAVAALFLRLGGGGALPAFLRARTRTATRGGPLLLHGVVKSSARPGEWFPGTALGGVLRWHTAVVYALDAAGGEPSCFRCFPGRAVEPWMYAALARDCGAGQAFVFAGDVGEGPAPGGVSVLPEPPGGPVPAGGATPVDAGAMRARREEAARILARYPIDCRPGERALPDDRSATGSEFCNFIAAILTVRLVRRFSAAGLLAGHTCGELMALLAGCRKARVAGGDWALARLPSSRKAVLAALGMLPPEEGGGASGRGRGRPRNPAG